MSKQNDALNPDPWLQAMRAGDFESAWQHCDQVLAGRAGKPCWHLPRHFQFIWNGGPLHGRIVLVRCYHGLGDTIQFIRYMPVLRSIAGKVIVWAQPKLTGLLRGVDGIDEILPLHDGSPEAHYDADVEIMELPHIFRTRFDTIPSTIPYIKVFPEVNRAGKSEFAVGLAWRAGDWDDHRSVPYALLEPLKRVAGVSFYIVQPGARAAGWDDGFGTYQGEFGLEEYAGQLLGLDLLISIDSMPVHLAGALGVPVWTLLQANADWRWMDELDYSPWYPGMRLFRQAKQNDWGPVIRQVADELMKLVREKNLI
jgi:hypothetical protein